MNETIVELTQLWYELVQLDHHKDRDCHWTIQTQYSYGSPPAYDILHAGYLYKDVDKSFNSYQEAESALMLEICRAIWGEHEVGNEQVKDLIEVHPQWSLVKSVGLSQGSVGSQ